MFTSNTVTIITASIGHQRLPVCLKSVQDQTFPGVEHLVVIDGQEHEQKVRSLLEDHPADSRRRQVITLSQPTGKDNWNGHRIYAGMSFLADTEFVCYLDEDNWIDPDHVESLVAAVRSTPRATWSFSLRKICAMNGDFLVLDNCESLGHLHHVYDSREEFHIDTGCYLLSRIAAVAGAPIWYRPTRLPPGMPVLGQIQQGGKRSFEPDTAMCRLLLQHFQPACSSLRHTLNYTVGNRSNSVRADYFLRGNEIMRQAYPNGLPWEK